MESTWAYAELDFTSSICEQNAIRNKTLSQWNALGSFVSEDFALGSSHAWFLGCLERDVYQVLPCALPQWPLGAHHFLRDRTQYSLWNAKSQIYCELWPPFFEISQYPETYALDALKHWDNIKDWETNHIIKLVITGSNMIWTSWSFFLYWLKLFQNVFVNEWIVENVCAVKSLPKPLYIYADLYFC